MAGKKQLLLLPVDVDVESDVENLRLASLESRMMLSRSWESLRISCTLFLGQIAMKTYAPIVPCSLRDRTEFQGGGDQEWPVMCR